MAKQTLVYELRNPTEKGEAPTLNIITEANPSVSKKVEARFEPVPASGPDAFRVKIGLKAPTQRVLDEWKEAFEAKLTTLASYRKLELISSPENVQADTLTELVKIQVEIRFKNNEQLGFATAAYGKLRTAMSDTTLALSDTEGRSHHGEQFANELTEFYPLEAKAQAGEELTKLEQERRTKLATRKQKTEGDLQSLLPKLSFTASGAKRDIEHLKRVIEETFVNDPNCKGKIHIMKPAQEALRPVRKPTWAEDQRARQAAAAKETDEPSR